MSIIQPKQNLIKMWKKKWETEFFFCFKFIELQIHAIWNYYSCYKSIKTCAKNTKVVRLKKVPTSAYKIFESNVFRRRLKTTWYVTVVVRCIFITQRKIVSNIFKCNLIIRLCNGKYSKNVHCQID